MPPRRAPTKISASAAAIRESHRMRSLRRIQDEAHQSNPDTFWDQLQDAAHQSESESSFWNQGPGEASQSAPQTSFWDRAIAGSQINSQSEPPARVGVQTGSQAKQRPPVRRPPPPSASVPAKPSGMTSQASKKSKAKASPPASPKRQRPMKLRSCLDQPPPEPVQEEQSQDEKPPSRSGPQADDSDSFYDCQVDIEVLSDGQGGIQLVDYTAQSSPEVLIASTSSSKRVVGQPVPRSKAPIDTDKLVSDFEKLFADQIEVPLAMATQPSPSRQKDRSKIRQLPRLCSLELTSPESRDPSAEGPLRLIDKPIAIRFYGVGGRSIDDEALTWLLADYHSDLTQDNSFAHRQAMVAISPSFRRDGILDGLTLLASSRALLICLANRKGEAGVSIASELGWLRALVAGKYQLNGRPLLLVGFDAAITALSIFGSTGFDVIMHDLTRTKTLGSGHYQSNFQLCAKVLGSAAGRSLSGYELAECHYDSPAAADKANAFRNCVKDSLAGWHYAQHSKIQPNLGQNLINTQRLGYQDLRMGANILSIFQAITTNGMREYGVGFEAAESKSNRKKVEITNDRYRTMIRYNSRQALRVTTSNGQTLSARATTTNGKQSNLRFVHSELGDNDQVEEITVKGREDPNLAVQKNRAYWRRVLLHDPKEEIDEDTQAVARRLLDPSGLLYPLLRGVPPVTLSYEWFATQSLFQQPTGRQYNVIERGRLDPSQKAAAKGLLSPLQLDNRIRLIHGPPGTGKTTVVGEVARQWVDWSAAWTSKESASDSLASIWICCQSNAAILNVALSLQKSGVKYKILVSDQYFREWHEHLYKPIQDHLMITTYLEEQIKHHWYLLQDVRIILCTIDCLSSPTLEKAGLFRKRPINLLLVDEASQLVLGAYPHVLAAHPTIGRIGFFGDHHQLAPYGSESLPHVESIFELDFKEKAEMLTRSYRLPTAICNFVSREIYGGLLVPGPNVSTLPLEDCVRFVDVASGEEVKGKGGRSYSNLREVQLLCSIVRNHLTGKDWRIITPYNAQRDAIERQLKQDKLEWEARVFSVDAFQGQEAEIILVSLVRDGEPDRPGHGAGFLANVRRANVMLTRTKSKMYILSSKRFLIGEGARGGGTLIASLAREVGEERGWCNEADVFNGNRLLDHASCANTTSTEEFTPSIRTLNTRPTPLARRIERDGKDRVEDLVWGSGWDVPLVPP